MSKKQIPIVRIVVCDKCNNHLWKQTILSWFENGKKDPILGATQWESANELVTDQRPKDWTCPICKRPFVWEHKNGARMIKMVDPEKGEWSKHWI